MVRSNFTILCMITIVCYFRSIESAHLLIPSGRSKLSFLCFYSDMIFWFGMCVCVGVLNTYDLVTQSVVCYIDFCRDIVYEYVVYCCVGFGSSNCGFISNEHIVPADMVLRCCCVTMLLVFLVFMLK